ncbi:MAG: peptidylprolyl isomerase [Actinomycetota bacterium]
MNRFATAVAVLCFLLAACGVDRASDDVVAADTGSDVADGDGGSADDGSDDGAGSNDAAGSDDGAPEVTTTTTLFVPPTTGAPDDVALSVDFGDATWEITHGELNSIVVPTQENQTFVELVFRGSPPPDFTLTVLTENLFAEAVRAELRANGGELTDDGLTTAEEGLLGQVQGLLAGEADPVASAQELFDGTPYLGFLAEYQAAQDALTNRLAETADPADGIPCVSHILLETEADADAVLDRLDAGEDFDQLAIETSTGPSGPNGGELGCAPSSQYVAPFAEAVDAAAIGEFVGPVETQFGFHVLVVERTEVDGRSLAAELLEVRVAEADVTVDENLGVWDPERLAITPAGS